MQEGISMEAARLLEKEETNINVKEFADLLAHYKAGDIVFPGAIQRNLKCKVGDVYNALDVLKRNGVVEQVFDVYCPSCQRHAGWHYKSIEEIPDEVFCGNCDFEIEDPLSNTVVLYQIPVARRG